MRIFKFFFLIVPFVLFSCVVQKTSTTQGTRYSEDLSALRPKTETMKEDTTDASETLVKKSKETIPAIHTINNQLDAVLDSIDRINLNSRFVQGYTIQVYSGDREGALNVKRELTMSLPDLESEVKYDAPTFRVKAGRYFERLDAQKDYMAIKKYFPSAIVIPERIAIN
jgi:hypothetical protein